MNYIIGCDAHKHYSQFAVYEKKSKKIKQVRVNHEPGAIRDFLAEYPEGTPVALESIGNWYWIVDEIEQAGCQALMAHAAKAKAMMGNVNKTDKLDARGLVALLQNGTLPTVWIAPGEVRDERELPRTRMALCKIRVALKNRIHATWRSTTSPWRRIVTSSLINGPRIYKMQCNRYLLKPRSVLSRKWNSWLD